MAILIEVYALEKAKKVDTYIEEDGNDLKLLTSITTFVKCLHVLHNGEVKK